jgi:lipoprotein-anchoring transpeptidase ErfK/SrfK
MERRRAGLERVRLAILTEKRIPRQLIAALAALAIVPLLAVGAASAWRGYSEREAAGAAAAAITSAQQQLDADQRQGADPAELEPLRASLAQAIAHDRGAHAASDHQAAAGEANRVEAQAAAVGARLEQDEQAIRKAAATLESSPASTDALRDKGQSALVSGRNYATVGTWTRAAGVSWLSHDLERYGQMLGDGDRQQVALGAAGAGFYSERLQQAMLRSFPAKLITISIHDQELTEYEHGRSTGQTPVTTGKVPDLATDIGPMKVLKKDSPWKMHSPWPKGSPNWYPDTVVQMVVWFTSTGEGMHDASWQSTPYGPGSELGPDASHGCVHVPFDFEKQLFGWAEIGTPVIVFPGDGSPLQAQLAQRTVDDNGTPTTGPRGA